MDGNLHAGNEIIPWDLNICNGNGKLLEEFSHLTIINATNPCDKVITRKRVANGKVDEAALDFFITCKKILPIIDKMEVEDVNKLTRFCKNKTISSDHSKRKRKKYQESFVYCL